MTRNIIDVADAPRRKHVSEMEQGEFGRVVGGGGAPSSVIFNFVMRPYVSPTSSYPMQLIDLNTGDVWCRGNTPNFIVEIVDSITITRG